jgi:hypothetical protein
MEGELRINARGLSVPGPRLMVQSALEKAVQRWYAWWSAPMKARATSAAT